jgi:hypothetical protein
MSEDQLKCMKKYIDENLEWEFIKSLSSLAEYSVMFILKKRQDKMIVCWLLTT